jgi:hypothetical protein
MYLILVAMGILVFCIEPIYGSDWLGEASLATSISFYRLAKCTKQRDAMLERAEILLI